MVNPAHQHSKKDSDEMDETNFPPGQEEKIEAGLRKMLELGVSRYEVGRWRENAHATATFFRLADAQGSGTTGLAGLLAWLERPPGPGRNLAMPLLLIGMELGKEAEEHFEAVVEQFDYLARQHPAAAKILREQVLWRTHSDLVPRADAALSA